MRIANNAMANNTHRQYTINNSAVANSTEKLSSGYRINRAGDDAAGLAISEKMRAQIKGLNMASKNSQDAISLVQTAEGALTETHSILQRMRELSVQAASDTNADGTTGVDREALNEEFQALKDEITDISKQTKFNGKLLLDGSMGVETAVTSTDIRAGLNGITEIGVSGFADKSTSGVTTYTIAFDNTAHTATISASGTGVTFTGGAVNYTSPTAGEDLTLDFSSYGAGKVTIKTGLDYAEATSLGTDSLTFTADGAGATIQTGADKGETLNVSIGDMGTESLGLKDAKINTRDDASSSIETVNKAINDVSTQRAKLGAYQNRLQHKINNLDTSAENLQAAESRIRDLDMAKEMTAYTKNNILVQASTAMLAQANAAPQGVLQLLQ
jgi:flagellin